MSKVKRFNLQAILCLPDMGLFDRLWCESKEVERLEAQLNTYRELLERVLTDRLWCESKEVERLKATNEELLEALKAHEKSECARRTFESIGDPMYPNRFALKLEAERTEHVAATLRKSAIAKAKGEQP